MSKINKILDYGLLAELSYLRLENKYYKQNNFDGEIDKVLYTNEGLKDYFKATEETLEESLERNIIKSKNEQTFTDKFKEVYETVDKYRDIQPDRVTTMINLLDRYTIKDFSSDDGWIGSDFQGMLLQDNHTRKYIIAFRGTSSIKDALVDIAIAKITMNHNFQYNEAIEFVKLMKRKHGIEKDNLILTGHSLGGILAQSIGVSMKIKAFAYNPLGTSKVGKGKGMLNILIEVLEYFNIVNYDEDWINKNIITISYNDIGLLNGDVLSNIATKVNTSKHLGIKIDFYGENVGLEGHSIITLNKLLEKQSIENLTTIDDIISFNQEQKTLFKDILEYQKISATLQFVKNNKCLFAVETKENIYPLIGTNTTLIDALKSDNIDSFMINGRIKQVENKTNFGHKLYYNYHKNKLLLKVKNFDESSSIITPIIQSNDKLKKYDVLIELEGEQ
ncbi:MAG: hypothetical protein RBR07_09700 [Arcobacteraceae bacterium]|nr:hypothetical protein [Arcobacteraceae bacterium]